MTSRQYTSAGGQAVQNGTIETQQRAQYYYPAIFTPQIPPTAYIAHGNPHSRTGGLEGDRTHSTASSGSGSSQDSYHKQKTPSFGSQWPSPTLDRTLVDSDPFYSSQSTQRHDSLPTKTRQSSRQPEMVEANSPALAYIRERQRIEEQDVEEDDEDDHALWVLVRQCLV